MSNLYTYSDPTLSLWQAAVAEVHRRHDSVQSRMAAATKDRMALAPPTLLSQDDLMAPALALGASAKAGRPVATPAHAPLSLAASAELVGTVVDCAKTAAEFLAAEITGNHAQSAILAGELKDSTCDVGWSECLAVYLEFKLAIGNLPYRPNKNPVLDLGQRTKLAIVGDWGTGDQVAINLLQQVASLSPDVLIHLGDVYYAGTQNEEQSNFLDICRSILGNNVMVVSLCGNHDMYSGGNGYYWLVDQLNQQASYFCLQNANWQFLAMDTGHNDNNPITVATNMTSLMTYGSWAEEDWLLDKINLAGQRKTVLLSHHQLFSPFGSVGSVDGQAFAYNKNLRATFQAVMSDVTLWFWGHEHTLAIFDPYMNLQRGRCVGASAVPVFTDQQSYKNASGLETYGGLPYPTWNAKGQLGNNGTSYNNCFAIMTLNGASATVDYYEVPILGKASKLAVTDSI
jgi:Calcineurin-like phosphoesterase